MKTAGSSRFSTPDAGEVQQARVASRALAVSSVKGLRVSHGDGSSTPVAVPETAYRLFLEILSRMAQGKAVALVPAGDDLTTQQAADFLGVSRPYVVKLLEAKAIPCHRVGTRRRITFANLMAYWEKAKGQSRDALVDLAAQAQELKLGY